MRKCSCCDKDSFASRTFRKINRDGSWEAISETSVCVWRSLFGQPVHKQIIQGMCCVTTSMIQWSWMLSEQGKNISQITVKLECFSFKATPTATFGDNGGSNVLLVWPTENFLCKFGGCSVFSHWCLCRICFPLLFTFNRIPLVSFPGSKQFYWFFHFLSMCMTCFFKLALSNIEILRSVCYKTNPDPKQNQHLILRNPHSGWRMREQTL